jgi:LysM repeat protein
MSIETLRSVNGIGPRQTVPTGYALLVPMQRPTAEAAQSLADAVFTTVPAGRTFFHTVGRGDTLQGVAARYSVTTQDLKRWNKLTQDSVRTGQKLRVTSDVSPIKSAGHGRPAKPTRAKGSKGKNEGKNGVAAGRDRPVSDGGAKVSGTRVSANSR